MRILQVMAGAEQGGAETIFADMCLALHESGVSQKIVTRKGGRTSRLQDAGLDVECLPFGGSIDIYTPWKLRRIIGAYKPHIVQSWMSRAASRVPSSAGKDWRHVARLGGYYKLKYYQSADYFVANTPDIRDYLIREGAAEDRARFIPNFTDIDPVVAPVRKSDLDTPDEAKVALVLARYHPNKALDVMIRAASEISGLHVWLAGQGPLEGELKKLAQDLNVARRIHFLGWREDRGALLEAADICVIPSRHEPFGNVFIQAWAHKTPLISSRSEGPSQFVKDGEDGLLFDIDDVAGLVSALRRLMGDSALAEKMTARGFDRFGAEFSREKTVASYLAYYTEILAKAGISLS
jgi:glycosyltransferase involved in cell wall biosynthesis